uniref:Titin-like n=1 Tax=Diabrotica virgifera virgifera TaxID=50390 RepID=A0A6P7GVE1_DIAVI
METWNSEWVDNPEDLLSLAEWLLDEAPPESPTCSRGSNEYIEGECDTKNEKCEESVIKTNPTNVFLAKKRLQAYSKQIGKPSSKEEKLNVSEGKHVKLQAKKTRKNPNSYNKAKSVIEEIEEIKKREIEDLKRRQAVATAIRSMSIHGPPSPDRSSTFKRRDQKQRNYRRSDGSNIYKPTSDDSSRRRGSREPYSSSREPRSWSEYRKPITPRDENFKSVSRKDITNLSLLEKLYNFDSPSPAIEPLVVECETGLKTVPVCNLKVTNCRPHLVYSVNSDRHKESFISREQLFHLVSSKRKQAINDVINKQSKPPLNNKTVQSQPWYEKIMWRKSANPECKVLENSVGLSFLQTYSDEDSENETEEIVICSGIKQKPITPINPVTVFSIQNDAVMDNKDLKIPRVLAPETTVQQSPSPIYDVLQDDTEMYTPEMSPNEMSQSESIRYKSGDETGVLTPEISSSQLLKVTQVEEQTPEKRQTQVEEKTPEKRQLDSEPEKSDTQEKEKEKVLKDKKKTKRKLEQPVDEEIPKHKKKKKLKKRDSHEDSDGSQEKRKKKKPKKAKNKEKISKKPKTSTKKSKKKDVSEVNVKKKKAKKKKKKTISVNAKSPLLDDLRKKLKKKAKKKASQKVEAPSKCKSSENVEISKTHTRKEKHKNNYSESDSESRLEPVRSLEIEIKKEVDQNIDPVQEKNIPTHDISVIPIIAIKTEPVDEDFNENQNVPPQKTVEFNDTWESEEEESQTIKPNLNSGWESDEEDYKAEERQTETREDEIARNNDAVLDLEIPLNIKPFKKRDSQIFISKKPLVNIDPSDLETEKAIVVPIENQNAVNTQVDCTPKRGRWDRKESSSEVHSSELKTEHLALNVNTFIVEKKEVLENEYEEFMKAVTSKSAEEVKTGNVSCLSSSEVGIDLTKMTEKSQNVTEVIPRQTVVPAKDIPFIPMPDERKLQTSLVPTAKMDHEIPLNLPSHRINVVISKPTITTRQLIENKTEFAQSGTPTKTPFSFTSLVLPTKKSLIDNSNLKLGDSDDENQKMKSVSELRKEYLGEHGEFDTVIHKIQKNSEFMNPEPKNTAEPVSERHRSRSRSPLRSSRRHDEKSKKRSPSPKRDSHRRRDSPRRRGYSPRKDYSPRRRKSPDRYRDKSRQSPGRKYSSRRSHSPNYRKRTPSPRRRSPRRSVSPRDRSNKKSSRTRETSDRMEAETKRQTSSPLERLKRSVADSTISDDSLLPQPSVEDYTHSPIPLYFDRMKQAEMRKALSDNNIQVKLGMRKEEFRPISTTYDNFYQNQFSQSSSFSTSIKSQAATTRLSNFVQVGNMVQIVPTDLEMKIDDVMSNIRPENKSQILQVGNMLQIVPAEVLPDLPPLPPSSKKEEIDIKASLPIPIEKPSAETTMKQKIAERRTERDKRRKEREERRQEKENRRREKEKRRQIKMKQKTENMIKKALQLEVDSQDIKDSGMDELPAQWPPIHLSGSSKDSLNKSILVRGIRSSKSKRKVVQFADGVRPGEGTSPSAGEELTASLSTKVLPKEKRYTKTKMRLKHNKKKVKVKIIKPTDQTEESDEDNLPPPSPPPGSPPPHLFPPRIKAPPLPSHPPYVSNIVNQNTMFRTPPVNMLMMPQSTLADSPMQVHSYAQYSVPPLPPTKPPPLLGNPLGALDSSSGSVHRNHHYNYAL